MTTERGDMKSGGDRATVTLFAAIDLERHAALRAIASVENRSLTDVVGDALDAVVAEHSARFTKEPEDSANRS